MVKILFLVKNGLKGRHGCVKSEHVLYEVLVIYICVNSIKQEAPPPSILHRNEKA